MRRTTSLDALLGIIYANWVCALASFLAHNLRKRRRRDAWAAWAVTGLFGLLAPNAEAIFGRLWGDRAEVPFNLTGPALSVAASLLGYATSPARRHARRTRPIPETPDHASSDEGDEPRA